MESLWIKLLPEAWVNSMPGLSLLLVGYFAEKNFVGRIATFCNTLAINLHLMLIQHPPEILVWYANIGLVMGIVGIVAYQSQNSLSQYYYKASWAYCSIIVGLIILFVH